MTMQSILTDLSTFLLLLCCASKMLSILMSLLHLQGSISLVESNHNDSHWSQFQLSWFQNPISTNSSSTPACLFNFPIECWTAAVMWKPPNNGIIPENSFFFWWVISATILYTPSLQNTGKRNWFSWERNLWRDAEFHDGTWNV